MRKPQIVHIFHLLFAKHKQTWFIISNCEKKRFVTFFWKVTSTYGRQILGSCEQGCLRRAAEVENEEAAPQRHSSGTCYLEGRRIPPTRAHTKREKQNWNAHTKILWRKILTLTLLLELAEDSTAENASAHHMRSILKVYLLKRRCNSWLYVSFYKLVMPIIVEQMLQYISTSSCCVRLLS